MRLRTAVLALTTLVAFAGALEMLMGRARQGATLLAVGVVGSLLTVFEQWRYRKRLPPAARWEPTGERFEDPSTGELMEVLYDPVTGERRYEPVKPRSP